MHPLLAKATVFAEGLDHPECVAVHPDGTIWAGGEAGQIYRISSEERQRASCPEDSINGDALAIPRSSGDSSPNVESIHPESKP